jgi:two-component system, LuxR family, sensor kinase FixL
MGFTYGVSIGAVALAMVLRYLLHDTLDVKAPYLEFYPAIFIAGWYGGLGPGAVATLVSGAAAMYFVLPPPGFAVGDPEDQLSLAIFIATGLVITWLNDRLRRAEDAHRAAAATAITRAERLDASEARWRAIIDSAVDGIVVIDAQGRIESFNPAAERLFGYAQDEVLGKNVNMLMPSPYREEHDMYLARYLKTGQAKIIGVGREVQGRRKDGSVFPLHLSVAEFTIQGARKFTGILNDVSTRVQLETQLREQATLARMGEMAAVIAHEVKNPLAGIRGVMQVFGQRLSNDAQSVGIVAEIVSRIDSLDRLMKDLLLFARPPKITRAPTDLMPLIASTVSLLNGDPSLRDVDIEVDGSVPPIPADPQLLQIVFQNLLINSAHAMHGKGKIRVSISAAGPVCQIAFVDAGPGIPTEIREHVFTPFFTTKARGTGLGLPMAKRLVEAHNGQILIDCPAGGGTSVIVQLPIGSV